MVSLRMAILTEIWVAGWDKFDFILFFSLDTNGLAINIPINNLRICDSWEFYKLFWKVYLSNIIMDWDTIHKGIRKNKNIIIGNYNG
jgi:hypothetical protein